MYKSRVTTITNECSLILVQNYVARCNTTTPKILLLFVRVCGNLVIADDPGIPDCLRSHRGRLSRLLRRVKDSSFERYCKNKLGNVRAASLTFF